MTNWIKRLWGAMRPAQPAPVQVVASDSARFLDEVDVGANAAVVAGIVAYRGFKLGTWFPCTDRCPCCGATDDWHPDPSGPNGETWMVCEACGLMRDHQGKVAGEPLYVLDHEGRPVPTGAKS